MQHEASSLRIAIVGPCGAGKSSLASELQARGLHARQIAQEHSYVPTMWQKLTKPDVLIYLQASFECCNRRKPLDWGPADHAEQLKRLAHARQHCDLLVQTDDLTPQQVAAQVLQALGIGHAPAQEV
ncbi:MAG: hypothetical protein PVF70_03145 [Anaerolineales bacterium]